MTRFLFFVVLALSFAAEGWADLIADPAGDTFGVGPVQIDIISYSALSNGNVSFLINFATAVMPASAGQSDSITGFIDIDLDKDAATGGVPWTTVFSPPPSLTFGMDMYVDLGSELWHPGTVDVFSNDNVFLISAPITFSDSGVSLSFPWKAAGDTFNYAMVVGTLLEPTDRAPNGDPFAPVPEPRMVLPLGVLLGIAALRRLRVCAR